MTFQVGDYVTLSKGTTSVTGQCMGFRVDQSGKAQELWIDGFYSAFELGEDDRAWRVVDVDEL
jgi:hypothetical protein